MEYAKIARDTYNEKWSRDYVRVLNQRMQSRQKLKEQFGDK